MRNKIISILDKMIREDGYIGLRSYEENDDGSFDLVTQLSEFGHETWLKYDLTGDGALFRVKISHLFGELDKNVPPEVAAGQMLRILWQNTESFSDSCAFAGVERYDGDEKIYATLNSYHHFLTAWRDEEIAEALRLFIFDLSNGFITYDKSLTMLKIYGG